MCSAMSGVFQAAVDAGVPYLVYACPLRAYASNPENQSVSGTHLPTRTPTFTCAVQRTEVNDKLKRDSPDLPSTRLRPGLIIPAAGGPPARSGPWWTRRRTEGAGTCGPLEGLHFQAVAVRNEASAYW